MTIPVHTLSGFLGSGKTSLLNHLLRNLPYGQRVAVIVNDFGEVAIDGQLLERGNYQMKELRSGCICCTLAGPLVESLADLAATERPDLILMESTGLAKPSEIARLLAARVIADVVHCGNIVCVVDAAVILRLLPGIPVVQDQLKCANTVILNKVDLTSPDVLTEVRAQTHYFVPPDALVLESRYCEIDPAAIFEERPVYLTAIRSFGEAHVHASPGHRLKSVSFERDQTFSCDDLKAMLEAMQGDVVRGKGIVQTDRGPKLFQLTLSGIAIEDWPRPVETSRLVLIAEASQAEPVAEKAAAVVGSPPPS